MERKSMKKIVRVLIFMIVIILCIFNCTYGFNLDQLNGNTGNTRRNRKGWK
jgi:uncharacterized protein YxeA